MANLKKAVKRGRPKEARVALYEKVVTLKLVGSDRDQLQEVAHRIHQFSHPLVIGGKRKHKVHISHTSTSPAVIFEGKAKEIG